MIDSILEFLEETGNDQDNDQGGRRKRKRGKDTAGIACCLEPCKSRHIDADRAGRGLGDGDHVRDVRVGKPVCPVGHLVQEGERCESAADGKEAGFEKFEKKL